MGGGGDGASALDVNHVHVSFSIVMVVWGRGGRRGRWVVISGKDG